MEDDTSLKQTGSSRRRDHLFEKHLSNIRLLVGLGLLSYSIEILNVTAVTKSQSWEPPSLAPPGLGPSRNLVVFCSNRRLGGGWMKN